MLDKTVPTVGSDEKNEVTAAEVLKVEDSVFKGEQTQWVIAGRSLAVVGVNEGTSAIGDAEGKDPCQWLAITA